MSSAIGWPQLALRKPQGARVLIVDDNPGIRSALKKIVLSLGYEVSVAATAEEGDQWMSSNSFDALLLDVELPRMSGVEFLKWALGRYPDLPIIMLTGLDDSELALECLAIGARNFLVKPPDPDFIEYALRDAVVLGQLLRERNEMAGGGGRTR